MPLFIQPVQRMNDPFDRPTYTGKHNKSEPIEKESEMTNRVSRVLSGLLIAASSILSGEALAQTAPQPIKVLVLNDQTGSSSAASGLGSVIAARLAAEDFGGSVAGIPIVVLSADHQNKADLASTIARKSFDVDNVDAIFDLSNSAASLAVQDLARERKKIVVHVGSALADLYGKQCSSTGALWLYDTYSLARGVTKAAVADGGTTWFFLTSDYAFGKSMQAEAERTLKDFGGTVVGSALHPIGTHDFSSYLLQAQSYKPQVIALASAGDDPINALKQAREFGIGDDTTKIVLFAFYLNYVKALGPDIAKGIQYLSGFYWDHNDDTRAFGTRFAAHNDGAMPTEVQAGVYSAVRHYLRAVEVTKSHDGLVTMRQMKAMPVNDSFAPGASIREDGRLMNDQYLVEAKGAQDIKGSWDLLKVKQTVKAADIVRPVEQGGCPYLDGPAK